MCLFVDWVVEEILYLIEDLIVGVNDGFLGLEVDSGGWLDEIFDIFLVVLVVVVDVWLEVDVCCLCVIKLVVWDIDEDVMWLDLRLVECLEDLFVCVVKIDIDLDVDLIDVFEVGFWDVFDVNVKDDVDWVLVDIFGVCCEFVVCFEDLLMVEVIVGLVVGLMIMFE